MHRQATGVITDDDRNVCFTSDINIHIYMYSIVIQCSIGAYNISVINIYSMRHQSL